MARQRKGDEPDSLHQRALEGETEAFWRLVQPHERIIFAAALGVLRSPEAAQDVIHDVYVRAFTTLGSLRSPDKLSFWLYSMARNVAHEHLRKQGKEEKIANDSRHGTRVISVPDMLVKEEELRLLNLAMQELPEAHRAILGLKYMNHLSCLEIAETLGIGVEAAKSRLFEARKLLRKKMHSVEKSGGVRAAGAIGGTLDGGEA